MNKKKRHSRSVKNYGTLKKIKKRYGVYITGMQNAKREQRKEWKKN